MSTFLSGSSRKQYKTSQTGQFGANGEGGWWAQCWSFDGIEGFGTGETEADAFKSAHEQINEKRAGRYQPGQIGEM